MVIRKRIALITILVICLLWSEANAADDSSTKATDYHRWVNRFAHTNVAGSFGSRQIKRLKLIVLAVEGDEKPPPEKPWFGSGIVTYGTEISTDGFTSYF
jgi:hypothetical protein